MNILIKYLYVLNIQSIAQYKNDLKHFFQDDFMIVEMVNRKIRFLWNAGGGSQVIQHNLTIETNDEQLLRDDRWYKIEVSR